MPLTLRELGAHGPVYGPEGTGPFPGVVILHGSEGPGSGWSHRFAVILAAHGYLALPYAYGEGDVWGAGAIRDVDLSRVPEAGRALAADPRCAAVALLGWSRGGEAAMHVAALSGEDTPFACIAAHAPTDHVVNAFDAEAHRRGDIRPERDPDGPRAWCWPGRDEELTPGRTIEIERAVRPIFLSHGTQDLLWDVGMSKRLAARLEAAERPADLYLAEGQGHAFDFDTEPELWKRLDRFFRRHMSVA